MNEKILLFRNGDTIELIKKLVLDYENLIIEEDILKRKEINRNRAQIFNYLKIPDLSELIADNLTTDYTRLDSLDIDLISNKRFEHLLIFRLDFLLEHEDWFILNLDTYFNHLKYLEHDKDIFKNQKRKLKFWIDYLSLLNLNNKKILFYKIRLLEEDERFDDIISLGCQEVECIDSVIRAFLELKKYNEALNLYNLHNEELALEYPLQIEAMRCRDKKFITNEWKKEYVKTSSMYTNIFTFDFFQWSPYVDKYILKNVDSIIYHYTDENALLNIISNKELWLTKYDYLNDFKEQKIIIELVRECNVENDVALKLSEYYANILKNKSLITKNSVNMEDAYIMSTSWEEDNLTLWGNYSNFTGYNIAFESNVLIKNIIKNNKNISPRERNYFTIYSGRILYDKDEIKRIMEEMISEIKADYNQYNGNPGIISSVITNHLIFLGNFVKSYLMSSEKEFRILLLGKNQSNYPLKKHYRTKANAIFPYIKVPFSNSDAVKSIKIGAVNNIDISESGVKQLLLDNEYKDIDVNRSNVTFRFK